MEAPCPPPAPAEAVSTSSPNASSASVGWTARWYFPASIALLLVVAALRFHGLSEQSLDYDEAVAALNSQASWSEVVENTRAANSTPILYPAWLRIAQEVSISNFSVRFLPALAGVLTVAVFLWWLPSVGVSRRAAFLAALLTAVSVPAITAAQGAREYSVDALLSALLIVGLLHYRRDGSASLLTACLFLGPLLQYGLVFFGAAVLGAAILMPGDRVGSKEGTPESRLRTWIRGRRRLIAPLFAFLAAAVFTYLFTLRHQMAPGGHAEGLVARHVPWNYYSGEWRDAGAVVEFIGVKMWELFSWLLTKVVAAGVVALFLVSGLRRSASAEHRRPADAVVLLFGLSLGLAAAAAVLRLYPLGGIRHDNYLGPVVFVFAGMVLASALERLSGRFRRPAARPLLFAVAVAGIAFLGAGEIARAHPYRTPATAEAVFEALAEQARPEDLVYVSGAVAPALRFHDGRSVDRYYLSRRNCWRDKSPCVRELTEIVKAREVSGRIWMALPFLYEKELPRRVREEWDERFEVEPVVFGEGDTDLFLIPNAAEVVSEIKAAYRAAYDSVVSGESGAPVLRSTFEVYAREGTLVYLKEPCSPEDTEARFLLHLFASNPEDLPAAGRAHGFENRDFDFDEYGTMLEGRCVALVPLPDYDLGRFRTGQWVRGEGVVWRQGARLDLERLRRRIRSEYESIASGARGEPAARSTFDLYLDGTGLVYLREPCSPEQVEARFFLHVLPPADEPQEDFENRDFDFAEHGLAEDGRCLALVPLPAGEIGRLRTGQGAGEESWSAEFPGRPASGGVE